MLKKNILAKLFPALDSEEGETRPILTLGGTTDEVQTLGGTTDEVQTLGGTQTAADDINRDAGFVGRGRGSRALQVPVNLYQPQTTDNITEDEYSMRGTGKHAYQFPLQVPEQVDSNDLLRNPIAPIEYGSSDPQAAVNQPAAAAAAAAPPKALSDYDRARQNVLDAEDRLKNVRNEDKGIKGALKEGLQNFLYSVGQAWQQNPRADWKELLAVGGIGVGAGAINRKWNEQRKYQGQLQSAQQDFQTVAARTKFENELANDENQRTARTNTGLLNAEKFAEMQKKNNQLEYDKGFRRAMAKLKLGYKRGAVPALDDELKQYGIEIEQWDDNKRTFWRGRDLLTFDERGEAVPVMENGKPVTDETRAPVTINYEGQNFTVSQSTAFTGLTNAGRTNVGIANQESDDQQRYGSRIAALKGDIATAQTNAKAAQDALTQLTNAANGRELYADEIRRKQQLEDEIRTEQSKISGFEQEIQSLPRPKNKSKVAVPKVVVDETEFSRRLDKQGTTDPKIRAQAAAQAKADGIIK